MLQHFAICYDKQIAIASAKAFCYRAAMNAKQFLDKHGRDAATEVAEKAGTNIAYFSQIAYGHRSPSRKLALRLVEASGGEMTFVDLMMPVQEAA